MGWKSFGIGVLIGIGIIILALAGIGIWTYIQAKELIALAKDSDFRDDIDKLLSGQCDKLENVQVKLDDAERKLRSGCKNPVIKYFAKKYIVERDICDVDSLIAEIEPSMERARNYCSSS